MALKVSEQANGIVTINEKAAPITFGAKRKRPSTHAGQKQLPIQGNEESSSNGCRGRCFHLWSRLSAWYSSLPKAIRLLLNIIIALLLLYVVISIIVLIIWGLRIMFNEEGKLIIKNCMEYHYLYWMRIFPVKALSFDKDVCNSIEMEFDLKSTSFYFFHHFRFPVNPIN